jgi:hypothetical protein
VTWPHKNHEVIFRALHILKGEHGTAPLDCVADDETRAKAIRKHCFRDELIRASEAAVRTWADTSRLPRSRSGASSASSSLLPAGTPPGRVFNTTLATKDTICA